jgi:CubicO group peptidase (beta-lactamase class C family)
MQKQILLLFLLCVCGSGAAGWEPDGGVEAKVDAYVKPFVEGNNFSGTILIAKGGKILVDKGYGLANYELSVRNTPRTRFHIASVSKSFTAAAILMLQERGLLNVADPLSKFIPDYPAGDKITIHHLLTHTSGIPNVNNLPGYQEKSLSRRNLTEIIKMFEDKPLEFEPGARFRYSNSNYNLLAYIIEKVSGKSYGEFLEANIFRPLGMTDTGNDSGSGELIADRASGYVPVGIREVENAPSLNWSIKTGNGSLYSTVDDLYKWDRALYTDTLLTSSSRKKMFTDYGGFGYGWFVRKHSGRRVIAINGRSPGFTSSMERFVDDDVCVILAANTYSGITQSMADDLAAIVFGQKYEALSPPVRVDPTVLDSYTGQYRFGEDFAYNPGSTVRVERKENGLFMLTTGGDTYLIPQPGDRFIDRLFGGTVTFEREPQGNVNQLTWNFGTAYVAKKLKQP